MKNILIFSLIIVFELSIMNATSASVVSGIDSCFQQENNNSTGLDAEDDNNFPTINNTINNVYSIFYNRVFYVDSFRLAIINKAYNVRAPPVTFS